MNRPFTINDLAVEAFRIRPHKGPSPSPLTSPNFQQLMQLLGGIYSFG